MGFKNKRVAQAAAPQKGHSSIWKLNLEKDIGIEKPCHFAILHRVDDLWQTTEDKKDNGDLHIHYVKGMAKAPLCNLLYFDDDDENAYCEYCQMDTRFGKNRPVRVKTYLSFIFELLGKKGTSKDGEKEFDINPVKLVEVSAGKQNCNFMELDDAVNNDLLSVYDDEGSIWKITKQKKGISVPIPADLRKLGKQFDPKVPKEILDKYNPDNFKAGELMGLILSQYSNIKKDHPMFEEIGVIWPPEEAPRELGEEKEDKSSEDSTPDLDG